MDDRPGTARSLEVWAEPAASVAATFETDTAGGLSSESAVERLSAVGPNELDSSAPVPIWRRVARQFVDPLVGLLVAAIGISTLAWAVDGADGVPIEAIVIAAIVVANAAIGAWQEERAVRAVAALRRLAGIHATVIRDGRTQVVSRTELVPGDLLVLAQGDAVGADCRLIETASLVIAEAPLTGESTPVAKSAEPLPADTVLADRTDMAYQGTAVASGRGIGIVVATGMRSELGRVASLIDAADTEPTPLEVQIDWLGKMLGLVVVVLAAIVVATIMLTSEVTSFRDYVDATLVGVSLAVAAVPEGLPAILTIVLALGVQRMAGQRAIVKQLSSVETLGAASVICTDKTGTLTRNEMSVVAVVVPGGRVQLTGVGYVPIGRLVGADGGDVPHQVHDEVVAVLRAGSIANDASLHLAPDGTWEVRGDPTEIALLVAEQKLETTDPRSDPRRVGEIPFDADRKLMSTVNDGEAGEFLDAASRLVMFTKGAPDVLVDRCVAERVAGVVQPLDSQRREEIAAAVDALADEALRPLAVAYRPVDGDEADPTPSESELILLGVVGIADPPRAEALEAIRQAHAGGIRVVMITGDHPRTASSIGGQLGLGDSAGGTGSVVTGVELDAMDDERLSTVVTEVDVYARVDPEHKLRIVRSLQRHGHVTAMTGDGVNDAPALKQADIGVAMGINGTEVSKEAADMILADDDFATILGAVREGREIFSDIRKFLRYLLASNTGEVLVVFLGVVLATQLGLDQGGLAVPLLATQILWINLVTDGALALALGVDPAVEDVMSEPPRAVGARIIDRSMIRSIAVIGTSTAIVGLVALDLRLAGGWLGGSGDIETARTMAFTTVVLAQVVNAFCSRSDSVSFVVGLFTNRLLWLAAAVTVAAQVAVVHVPFLSSAFATEPLSWNEWAVCSLLAVAVLVPAEASKWLVRRGDADRRR
ncbi:MAG: cation-translocating P-type ATPase [Ilumatobacteraceae bacterium]|nr:cation-translocating P-type ATPase [Ilumatobacteraceae bacterium]